MANADFSRSLRILARLLAYPDSAMRADLADLRAALAADRCLPDVRRAELEALAATLAHGDPIENEAEYVRTFDLGRSTSLHLFEHVHGDSRERGPAMVDLIRTYEQGGMRLAPGELPDYLPAVLEFASLQPQGEALAFLGEIAHIAGAIQRALQQRKSPYAGVLAAVLALSGEAAATATAAVTPDDALDASWEEPPVFGGCSTTGQASPRAAQPVHFVRTGSPAAAAGAPLTGEMR